MDPSTPATQKEVAGFEIFHELMANKIRKILLVFSPFDAFLMEQGGSLTSRIVREYRGLNLSHPPRLIGVSCARDALALLAEKEFDLVITTPQLDDMDCFALGRAIKDIRPDLPVILLAHNIRDVTLIPPAPATVTIDRFYLWSPNPDFLMALVKNVEDHLNAARDTKRAKVRVLILVEDSPLYLSYFLPLIYKEVVKQTQAVLDESLNTEHRLLKMRARPKILVAQDFEEATRLYHAYRPYVFGVIADTRFPRGGKLDDRAGVTFLTHIRSHVVDLPLLMLSSESANRTTAEQIPAVFVDKNAPDLQQAIQDFFLLHLGFGAFIFRLPDGREVDRADSLRSFETKLAQIPDASLQYHAERNHFFTWVMARSEVKLAALLHREQIRTIAPEDLRHHLITTLHQARKERQQGIVSRFSARDYDADISDFVKIGQGAMGGKALGLAFMAAQFSRTAHRREHFPETVIQIPKTLVITTDGFDSFMAHNQLHDHSQQQRDDAWIMEKFLAAAIPDWLVKELAVFLEHNPVPLAVRSSSILEDAQYKPYAGLYRTYMIPNNSDDFNRRLDHLLTAIKLVYASTFYEGPQAFARTDYRADDEGMAVIIQHLAGRQYGDFFYPAISGVAQSHNCYARAPMKPEQGIAHIALGLGKTVVEGERSLRFSPSHPTSLPQFSTVDEILARSQRFYYVLRMNNYPPDLNFLQDGNLEKREIQAAQDDYPIQRLTSTFFPSEHRIRDIQAPGPKMATFAQVLKHAVFPLPAILRELLIMGRRGMGRDVEIEFAVDLAEEERPGVFSFLQIRPMAAVCADIDIRISTAEIEQAFCRSDEVLGHGVNNTISDIVFVRPETFKPENTRVIAREISRINGGLQKQKRSYLLIGFGRWGSADPWLGIPVQWQDISGVGAMIELQGKALAADPSQGTHFFQNITAMDIKYFTVVDDPKLPGAERSFINWQWLRSQPLHHKTDFLQHVRLDRPLVIKVDSRRRLGIMVAGS
jgi:CheY-like chemotaxis protein